MYKKNEHIHFIGIGGIGMSGIATILRASGYTVSGCDPDITQDTIKQLKSLQCSIYHGNNTTHCSDNSIDILVYIPMYADTIPAITQEITNARKKGIITITRAQLLAELMRPKYSIAVAGSHGKTTTSSLISHILLYAHYNPTIAVGGNIKNINSNAHLGTGNFFVAEADESDRSFLQLNPTFALVTNIDLEHLETYKDLDDIKQTFLQFMTNIPFYGKTIICSDNKNIQSLLPLPNTNILSYGIKSPADIYGYSICLNKDHSTFDVYTKTTKLGTVTLPLAGMHNVYNALGAIAFAQEIGISFDTIVQALGRFQGVDRRFSFHGTYNGAEIFDDYGHHPQEILNTILVARKRTKNKLIVVFQPHRYTRTEKLWNEFINTFSTCPIDTLIITDIYSAGEYPIPNITSQRLVHELQKTTSSTQQTRYIPLTEDFCSIINAIKEKAEPHDLILLLGAGKMHLIADKLTNNSL